MTNKLLLISVVCACNLVLPIKVPTYYEATRSRGSRQVDCKIFLSHYLRKIICVVLDEIKYKKTY